GQPLYYLPMTLLFLALYAVVAVGHRDPTAAPNRLSFSIVGLVGLAAVMTAFATEFVWLRRAITDMSFGGGERGADASVPLLPFTNSAGSTDLRTWNQFFSSLPPHLDFTVFGGFMVAALVVVPFSSGPLNRIQRMFAWLTIAVLLICTASPLATLI